MSKYSRVGWRCDEIAQKRDLAVWIEVRSDGRIRRQWRCHRRRLVDDGALTRRAAVVLKNRLGSIVTEIIRNGIGIVQRGVVMVQIRIDAHVRMKKMNVREIIGKVIVVVIQRDSMKIVVDGSR